MKKLLYSMQLVAILFINDVKKEFTKQKEENQIKF